MPPHLISMRPAVQIYGAAAANGVLNITFDPQDNFEDLAESGIDTVLFTYEISDRNGAADSTSFP